MIEAAKPSHKSTYAAATVFHRVLFASEDPPDFTASLELVVLHSLKWEAISASARCSHRSASPRSYGRTSVPLCEIDCRPRAAVVIEPVSADSLLKTGIFAGDFRLMPAGPRVQRQTRMREKARISGSFSRLVGSRPERRNAWLATQCRSHLSLLVSGILQGILRFPGSSSRFRSKKPLRCSTFPIP